MWKGKWHQERGEKGNVKKCEYLIKRVLIIARMGSH